MITILDIKRVKARKPHKCDMCGKKVPHNVGKRFYH